MCVSTILHLYLYIHMCVDDNPIHCACASPSVHKSNLFVWQCITIEVIIVAFVVSFESFRFIWFATEII